MWKVDEHLSRWLVCMCGGVGVDHGSSCLGRHPGNLGTNNPYRGILLPSTSSQCKYTGFNTRLYPAPLAASHYSGCGQESAEGCKRNNVGVGQVLRPVKSISRRVGWCVAASPGRLGIHFSSCSEENIAYAQFGHIIQLAHVDVSKSNRRCTPRYGFRILVPFAGCKKDYDLWDCFF